MTLSEPFSLEELRDAVRGGWSPKYVFFWGHTPHGEGTLGRECFSQWYPAGFTVEGTRYETAEHYMMCQKARLFGDHEAADRILAARHPSEVKQIGRSVRGFDEALWERHRFEIVVAGSSAKFAQNADLGAFLLRTHERVLVEVSPTDRIWGIGLAEGDADARSPERWRGLNLLGFALMRARAALRLAGS